MLDLDVAVILAAYLRGARGRGAVVRTSSEVAALAADGAGWRIELRDGDAQDVRVAGCLRHRHPASTMLQRSC